MAEILWFRYRWQICSDRASKIFPGRNGYTLHRDPLIVGSFEPEETSPSGWASQAQVELAPTVLQMAAMQSVAARELPPGSDRDAGTTENLERWLKGEVPVLATSVLDDELSGWILEWRTRLMDQARRCYELVRWVANARSSQPPLTRGRFEFSIDGRDWHLCPAEPPPAPFNLRADFGIDLGSFPWDGLSRLAMQDQVEPVGHSLIREASALRKDAPRAAVVLGAAAAETALKGAISVLAPDAAILVDRMQSPSPYVLLKEYIPTLPSRGDDPRLLMPPPKAIRQSVHWLSETRNTVVHSRNQVLRFPDLARSLMYVSDLVWLMDYHCGHSWAINYLSADLKREHDL